MAQEDYKNLWLRKSKILKNTIKRFLSGRQRILGGALKTDSYVYLCQNSVQSHYLFWKNRNLDLHQQTTKLSDLDGVNSE